MRWPSISALITVLLLFFYFYHFFFQISSIVESNKIGDDPEDENCISSLISQNSLLVDIYDDEEDDTDAYKRAVRHLVSKPTSNDERYRPLLCVCSIIFYV